MAMTTGRATLLSVATAVPEHIVTSELVKESFPKAFELDARRLTWAAYVDPNVPDHATKEDCIYADLERQGKLNADPGERP